MTEQPTIEELAQLALERFEGDLLALVQQEPYRAWPHVCITGLLELAGTMMRNGLQREPGAMSVLLDQIERLKVHVESGVVLDGPLSLH